MNGFKTEEHAREHANASAWQAVCAKLGHGDAIGVRAGGTLEENHDKRKLVRRAVNALTLATANRDVTVEETSAYQHAATLVARLDQMIDGFEPKAVADTFKPLRNQADFAAHYSKWEQGGSFGNADLTISDFVRGIANLNTTPAVRNALSVGTDASGGFTVPSILMPGIMNALAPASSLLQAGAGIVPLEEGPKNFTWAAVDTLPTAAWRLEGGAVPESDPAFRSVVGAPKSLSFRFKVSRELLADGRNLSTPIYLAIGQAFAKEMDRAGLRGSGTNPEPRGLLNLSGVQPVTNGTNGASLAATRYANIFSGAQAILTGNGPMPTAAIMAPRSLIVLGQQVDSTGQPLQAPEMLRDVKLIATSQIPVNLTVGSSSDCSEIYLGDFSQVLFTLRESPSTQLLSELYAGTGEVGFACHARVDVVVLRPTVFAVVTGVKP